MGIAADRSVEVAARIFFAPLTSSALAAAPQGPEHAPHFGSGHAQSDWIFFLAMTSPP